MSSWRSLVVYQKKCVMSNRGLVNFHIAGSIHGFLQARSCIHTNKNDSGHVCLFALDIPGGITMVLAHNIERCVVYLIPSKKTIGSCVVLTHGIDKG